MKNYITIYLLTLTLFSTAQHDYALYIPLEYAIDSVFVSNKKHQNTIIKRHKDYYAIDKDYTHFRLFHSDDSISFYLKNLTTKDQSLSIYSKSGKSFSIEDCFITPKQQTQLLTEFLKNFITSIKNVAEYKSPKPRSPVSYK